MRRIPIATSAPPSARSELSSGHSFSRRARGASELRFFGRILGILLIVAGVLTLTWVVVVWQWQDPFTAIYTHIQQSRLSHSYERRVAADHPPPPPGGPRPPGKPGAPGGAPVPPLLPIRRPGGPSPDTPVRAQH